MTRRSAISGYLLRASTRVFTSGEMPITSWPRPNRSDVVRPSSVRAPARAGAMRRGPSSEPVAVWARMRGEPALYSLDLGLRPLAIGATSRSAFRRPAALRCRPCDSQTRIFAPALSASTTTARSGQGLRSVRGHLAPQPLHRAIPSTEHDMSLLRQLGHTGHSTSQRVPAFSIMRTRGRSRVVLRPHALVVGAELERMLHRGNSSTKRVARLASSRLNLPP